MLRCITGRRRWSARADHNTARIGVRAAVISAIAGRAAGECRRQNERGAENDCARNRGDRGWGLGSQLRRLRPFVGGSREVHQHLWPSDCDPEVSRSSRAATPKRFLRQLGHGAWPDMGSRVLVAQMCRLKKWRATQPPFLRMRRSPAPCSMRYAAPILGTSQPGNAVS